MIASFKHKGLKRLFERDDPSRIHQDHLRRLKLILQLLENAEQVDDMRFPGSALHPLKGDLKGYWSVKVSGNWRIIFRFEEGDAYDVDYVDYH